MGTLQASIHQSLVVQHAVAYLFLSVAALRLAELKVRAKPKGAATRLVVWCAAAGTIGDQIADDISYMRLCIRL